MNPYYDERVTFLKEFNGSSTFDLTISNYQSIVKSHDTWFNDRQRNERKVGILENLKVRSFVIYSVTAPPLDERSEGTETSLKLKRSFCTLGSFV